MAKYIISITTLNEEHLTGDQLWLPNLPDTLNTLTEELSPQGALDLDGLYLVNDTQKALVCAVLDTHHLPFPVDSIEARLAEVVNLHDRRRRPEGPH